MHDHNRSIAFLCVLMAALLAGSAVRGQTDTAAAPTLYERLGGVYSIATLVDDFIERLYVNDTLNANPAIEAARNRVPIAGLKFHVTALTCQVTGGPEKYTGRSMKDAHAHLNIGEKEWQAMIADFKTAMNKFKVPEKEQSELLAIVEGTKADIVLPQK